MLALGKTTLNHTPLLAEFPPPLPPPWSAASPCLAQSHPALSAAPLERSWRSGHPVPAAASPTAVDLSPLATAPGSAPRPPSRWTGHTRLGCSPPVHTWNIIKWWGRNPLGCSPPVQIMEYHQAVTTSSDDRMCFPGRFSTCVHIMLHNQGMTGCASLGHASHVCT